MKTPFNENFDHINATTRSIKYIENLKDLLSFQNNRQNKTRYENR